MIVFNKVIYSNISIYYLIFSKGIFKVDSQYNIFQGIEEVWYIKSLLHRNSLYHEHKPTIFILTRFKRKLKIKIIFLYYTYLFFLKINYFFHV